MATQTALSGKAIAPWRLSDVDIKALLTTPLAKPALFDFSEPAHYFVNYSAPGQPVLTTPEEFYWGPRPGPSDCVWMVPGVTRHWSGRRSFWKIAP